VTPESQSPRTVLEDELDRTITRMVLAGQTNKAIARAAGIPEGTVKWRLHRMYRRLGVSSRVAFALALRRLNLPSED
jgi:DNA-binding NarL/FixJ family response regulator